MECAIMKTWLSLFNFPALELGNRDKNSTVKPGTMRCSSQVFLLETKPNFQFWLLGILIVYFVLLDAAGQH